MKNNSHHIGRRALAMLLVVLSIMSMLSMTAFAGQEDGYHNPAERSLNVLGYGGIDLEQAHGRDADKTADHETDDEWDYNVQLLPMWA